MSQVRLKLAIERKPDGTVWGRFVSMPAYGVVIGRNLADLQDRARAAFQAYLDKRYEENIGRLDRDQTIVEVLL